MARVTVEDCTKVINNRFELSVLAAHRARIISSGGEPTIERNNNKDAVVSLREIANKSINIDKLKEILIQDYQTVVALDKYGVEEMKVVEDDEDSTEIKEELASLEVATEEFSNQSGYEDEEIID